MPSATFLLFSSRVTIDMSLYPFCTKNGGICVTCTSTVRYILLHTSWSLPTSCRDWCKKCDGQGPKYLSWVIRFPYAKFPREQNELVASWFFMVLSNLWLLNYKFIASKSIIYGKKGYEYLCVLLKLCLVQHYRLFSR